MRLLGLEAVFILPSDLNRKLQHRRSCSLSATGAASGTVTLETPVGIDPIARQAGLKVFAATADRCPQRTFVRLCLGAL